MHKSDGQLNQSIINVLEIIGNADRGGMENYLKSFINYLPEDFRLTYLCPYDSKFTSFLRDLKSGSVYIAAIHDDPFWNSIQMATTIVTRHNIDVIHAHMPKAHALAGIVGSLTNTPVVATVHGMEITSYELGIHRTVGSHLITNNQQAFMQAIALGVLPSSVELIRNGVDTSFFNAAKKNRAFRGDVGIPGDSLVVGFMGRLEHEKGPDLFLKAAESIHHEMPNVHFVLSGDGSMIDELKILCVRMKIDEVVHFVNWHADTAHIYDSFDIVAHTSRSDGTSLVLMEAMACECPTVAIGVGGVLEIVENNISGLLAAGWEDVATKVLALLKEPKKRKDMGLAGRLRVEKLFNAYTNTIKVAEVIRRQAFKNAIGCDPIIVSENLSPAIVTASTSY